MVSEAAVVPVRVRILHNVAKDELGRSLGWMDGWHADHAMVEVFAYDSYVCPDVEAAYREAELAFRLFNVGDDPTFGEPSPIALEYRALRLRSLSVGDVVVVGDLAALACASMGWERINLPAHLDGEG